MSTLDNLQRNASVHRILPGALIIVVRVQWLAPEAIAVSCKDSGEQVANHLLYPHNSPRLEGAQVGRLSSFDGNALFRLVSLAHRIRLAHLFDPELAVNTSKIELLPHQVAAVYEAMLPPASRFVQSHIDREPASVQHVAMLRRGLALAKLANRHTS